MRIQMIFSLALTANVPPVCFAEQCYTEGQSVVLTGRVQIKKIPPDSDRPQGWNYPVLTLAHAVCLTSDRGQKIEASSVGIIAGHVKTGSKVIVKGDLESPQTGNDPPEDLLLDASH